MSFEEIKAEAGKFSGAEMSMAEFKYAFGYGPGEGEKMMGRLIAAGIFESAGKYASGAKRYRVK